MEFEHILATLKSSVYIKKTGGLLSGQVVNLFSSRQMFAIDYLIYFYELIQGMHLKPNRASGNTELLQVFVSVENYIG